MCAFKIFFGFDCPGCGLTHAVLACLRGDVLESITLHPMGVVAVLWGINFWWLRELKFSELSREIISYLVLLSFFVPWIIKMIV